MTKLPPSSQNRDPVPVAALRRRTVDAYALEARAKELGTRSIKADSQAAANELTIRCMDLTTLEGADTAGRVLALCNRARHPDPTDPSCPPVAAVCVYPSLVRVAVEAVAGSTVKVASVAGAFPSGQSSLANRLDDIATAVADGADEIDIVINRGAFLSGDYELVHAEILAAKAACGQAHLKTILEVGELGSFEAIRWASMIAMGAGSDVIKTSTGKIGVSATPPIALCMAEAIREFEADTGRSVGLKLAGGIRTAKQASHYLVLVNETLGSKWLDPDWFRFGASGLLNDVMLQRRFRSSGRYARPSDLPVD
ncbi:MAG TPA: deoxyribose-phosphate aldolase [Acidimicrobiaceae bacterium]|jgi:deoxyribose-phosphate aldolase|nr:deoxyribose-phosphate aldolase [Acidimicrobiaceae bacterium]